MNNEQPKADPEAVEETFREIIRQKNETIAELEKQLGKCKKKNKEDSYNPGCLEVALAIVIILSVLKYFNF